LRYYVKRKDSTENKDTEEVGKEASKEETKTRKLNSSEGLI